VRRALAAGAALALFATGCGVSGLAFRNDHRVDIVSPDDRHEVRVPVTIRWRSDLARRDDGGPFWAVFVDRAPIRPGQSLRAVADDVCNRTPRCPDVQYLRDRFVFLTDRTSVRLDVLPEKGSDERESARDRHEATIITVDAKGHRIGEAAWTVEFRVKEG
jgi:hypothetical protein